MNNRIKLIRENIRNENGKKLTQTQFANALHVTRDMIATYESGRVEPTPLFISSLCNMYNVNEEWLRTGKGDMYNPLSREDIVADLAKRTVNADEDDLLSQFILNLSRLDSKDWDEVNRIMKKLLNK